MNIFFRKFDDPGIFALFIAQLEPKSISIDTFR